MLCAHSLRFVIDSSDRFVGSKKKSVIFLSFYHVSNMFDKVPFEEQCNKKKEVLLPGRLRMDSEV